MSVVNSVGGSNNSLLWKDKGLEDAGLLHWKVLEQLWLKTQYAVELVQKNPFFTVKIAAKFQTTNKVRTISILSPYFGRK